MLTTLAMIGPHAGHLAFFPFFFIVPLFWIALIVVLALVFGARRRRWMRAGYGPFGPGAWGHGWGHTGAWGAGRNAERTLAERFAQGDIDEVEYRARLEVLRAQYPGPQGPQQG